MRRLILTVVSILLLCGFDAAQSLTPTEISNIGEIFSDYAKLDSPGCALGVYHNGAIAYTHGYGMASLELGVPITPQTVFDIGSTSKQFTAFSILLLQQQGKPHSSLPRAA